MRHGVTVESLRVYHRAAYQRWEERLNAKMLTKRERLIIRMLADGHCAESAAATLGIGYQVVKNHLGRARMKTSMTTYQLIAKVAVEDYKRGLMMKSAPLNGVPRI